MILTGQLILLDHRVIPSHSLPLAYEIGFIFDQLIIPSFYLITSIAVFNFLRIKFVNRVSTTNWKSSPCKGLLKIGNFSCSRPFFHPSLPKIHSYPFLSHFSLQMMKYSCHHFKHLKIIVSVSIC